MAYKGNEILRDSDQKIVYTNKMKEEIVKCMSDIIYFAENYCKIVHVDRGRVLIKFWDYQKKMVKALFDPPLYRDENGELEKKSSVVMLCPRQQGKTTVSAIYLLHYALFNDFKQVAILANKERTAVEILSKIKQMYEGLPLWLQVGVKEFNKQSILLANGTKILCASTSSSAIRGLAVNLLFLDEFAFIDDNLAEEFMNSVWPTISSGKTTKIIIVSTPNGMNHFYNIWNNAVKGRSTFYPVKINWWDHPERDEKFKKNMIRDRGIQFWLQEYQCCADTNLIKIINKNEEEKILSLGEFWNSLEKNKSLHV